MFVENYNVIDRNIYAYLIVDWNTLQILDGNKLANDYFLTTDGYPSVQTLFSPNADENKTQSIVNKIKEFGYFEIKNLTSIKKSGETFDCHVQISKVSDNIVFLVIKEYSNTTDLEIEQVVELFDNPIFVVKQDNLLTLSYASDECYQYLNINQNKVSFLSMVQEEKRLIVLQTLNEQIDLYGHCNVDIEVLVDESIFRLFSLNAFKSTYDGMLYGVLISAKKQSDLMKKIEYYQQYFDIMQKFSKDLLSRIDVKKKTLIHRGSTSNFIGLSQEVENFPEAMRDTRLIHPDDLEGYIAFVYRLMNGATSSFDVRFQLNDGAFEKYRLQASPIFDNKGNVVQVVGKSENIQKYVELKIRANYDALTSALNKQSFRELVESNISRAMATDKFALLFIDFDDFKNINDTMGHVFGDFLLEATGKRILNCIRSHDKLGRVGGDEFVVFFQFAPNPEAVLERAEAILHSLRREFTYGDMRYKANASVGISLFPDHGNDYGALYDKADKALYKSKELGKDIATIYSKDLDA